MTAAILLCGPSFAALSAPPPADILIGVKRAACRFPCGHAVILDIPDLRGLRSLLHGAPQVLTHQAYRPKYMTMPGLDVEAVTAGYPSGCDQWSSTAALALASHLGATRIEAYGADFGEGPALAEWDGYVSPEANYTAARWERERSVWSAVAAWLGGRGVEVERMNGAK